MSLSDYHYYIVKPRYSHPSIAFVWVDDSIYYDYGYNIPNQKNFKDIRELQIIPIQDNEASLYQTTFSGVNYQLQKKQHVYGDYYRYTYSVQFKPFLLCDKKISKRNAFIIARQLFQFPDKSEQYETKFNRQEYCITSYQVKKSNNGIIILKDGSNRSSYGGLTFVGPSPYFKICLSFQPYGLYDRFQKNYPKEKIYIYAPSNKFNYSGLNIDNIGQGLISNKNYSYNSQDTIIIDEYGQGTNSQQYYKYYGLEEPQLEKLPYKGTINEETEYIEYITRKRVVETIFTSDNEKIDSVQLYRPFIHLFMQDEQPITKCPENQPQFNSVDQLVSCVLYIVKNHQKLEKKLKYQQDIDFQTTRNNELLYTAKNQIFQKLVINNGKLQKQQRQILNIISNVETIDYNALSQLIEGVPSELEKKAYQLYKIIRNNIVPGDVSFFKLYTKYKQPIKRKKPVTIEYKLPSVENTTNSSELVELGKANNPTIEKDTYINIATPKLEAKNFFNY